MREEVLKTHLEHGDKRTGSAVVNTDTVWALLAEVEAHRSRALAKQAEAGDPFKAACQLAEGRGFVVVHASEWADALRAMGVLEGTWQHGTWDADNMKLVAAYDPTDENDSGVRVVTPEIRCVVCRSDLRLNPTDDGLGHVWFITSDQAPQWPTLDRQPEKTYPARVSKRVWGPDDEYLVVEVQVDENKFWEGDKVEVIVRKRK